MRFESFGEVLGYAIGKKVEAINFYKAIARRSKAVPAAVEAFKHMAFEERKHKGKMEMFFQENHEIQGMALGLNFEDYLEKLMYRPGLALPDVIAICMEKEDLLVKLLHDVAKKMPDKNQKQFLQAIAEEDGTQKQALKAILDVKQGPLGH